MNISKCKYLDIYSTVDPSTSRVSCQRQKTIQIREAKEGTQRREQQAAKNDTTGEATGSDGFNGRHSGSSSKKQEQQEQQSAASSSRSKQQQEQAAGACFHTSSMAQLHNHEISTPCAAETQEYSTANTIKLLII